MRNYLFILFLAFILSSCQLFDKEEDTPSFIYIDQIEVQANATGNEGTITSNISDAWVFLNDNNMGNWELPAKVPLYSSGTQNIKIIAGIRINGLQGYRAQYPFLDFYQKEVPLIKGEIIDIDPVIEYYTPINFIWKENFESAGISIDSASGSHTSIQLTSDPTKVIEGVTSGIVTLHDTISFYKGVSNEIFELPIASNPVYLEIDYKTDMDFIVFLISHNPVRSNETLVIGLKAKVDSSGNLIQNKVYIDLTFDVSTNYLASGYQIGISTSLPENQSSGTFIIDNIKLIHQ
ncbi:MAG: hypothetical protein JKY42_05110 [Flavobacteriales bacterium]|nr:hypothetical protein [Flavobacteriales bacterium]